MVEFTSSPLVYPRISKRPSSVCVSKPPRLKLLTIVSRSMITAGPCPAAANPSERIQNEKVPRGVLKMALAGSETRLLLRVEKDITPERATGVGELSVQA